LRYKGEEVGLDVVETEEAYTSRSSFFDDDPLFKHNEKPTGFEFSGRRVSRGLYETKSGDLVNADVNGAYNILRKVAAEANADAVEGGGFFLRRLFGSHPVQRVTC